MPGQKFELLPIVSSASSRKLQYIFHKESGLKIIAFPLINYPFQPNPNEICFYALVHQWWIAFETSGIQEHQEPFISEALSWYGAMQFYPQMCPQAIDPRKENRRNVN